MNYTYKVYYAVLTPATPRDRSMVLTAPTPVRALDIFHRNVQSLPKLPLGPADYRIIGLVHRYQDTTKEWIEAVVDLPNTPNPLVVNPDGSKLAEQTTEMPLNDARLEKSK